MQIATLTMSGLALVASSATLYFAYKAYKLLQRSLEQTKTEVDGLKTKTNRTLRQIGEAIRNLEM